MKVLFIIIAISILPARSMASNGENTHTINSKEIVLENYIIAFDSILKKRIKKYNKHGLKWIQADLKFKEDANLVKTLVKRTNIHSLDKIQINSKEWFIKVSNYKISFTTSSILLGKIFINGRVFKLAPKEGLASFQQRLSKSLFKNLGLKKFSLIDLLIPNAYAQNYNLKRVEALVVLNATGIVSITYDEPFWFQVDDYANDLAVAMRDELGKANKECKQKSEELNNDTRNRISPEFKGILNSLKFQGNIDHRKLISSLLKKFSTKNAVDKESAASKGRHKQLFGNCDQLLKDYNMFPTPEKGIAPIGLGLKNGLWVNDLDTKLSSLKGKIDNRNSLCQSIKKTIACLENLEVVEENNIANDSSGEIKYINLVDKTAYDKVNGSHSK